MNKRPHQHRVQGSMDRKIVATELKEERDKLNFDREDMKGFMNIYPEHIRELKEKVEKDVLTDPNLKLTHKFYEWTPQEI